MSLILGCFRQEETTGSSCSKHHYLNQIVSQDMFGLLVVYIKSNAIFFFCFFCFLLKKCEELLEAPTKFFSKEKEASLYAVNLKM